MNLIDIWKKELRDMLDEPELNIVCLRKLHSAILEENSIRIADGRVDKFLMDAESSLHNAYVLYITGNIDDWSIHIESSLLILEEIKT